MLKRISLIFLLNIFAFSTFVFAIPDARGYVNDTEGILENVESLEKKISDFEKETGIEIAILTTPNFEDTYIEDYAVKVFEKWKIGKADEDNGVLILVSKEQRQSKIEVGYGLEGTLTDGLTGRIQDVSMIPAFKQENFSVGVEGGVDAIIDVLSGEEVVGVTDVAEDSGGIWVLGAMFFAFLFLIPNPIVGGIIGFLVAFLLGTAFLGVLPGLLIGMLGGFLGFGMGFISKLVPAPVRYGMARAVFASGSRGGGSFGGFGGGSSGGGGSSRSW